MCHKSDQNICILASTAKAEPLLQCFHEEADDSILYHLSHAVKIDKYKSVIICHLIWMFLFVPYAIIHKCCTLILMNSDLSLEKRILECSFLYMKYLTKLNNVLPALHALTGCDLTSKV